MRKLGTLCVTAALFSGACGGLQTSNAESQDEANADAVAEARALPLEARLDLYEATYRKPGHPADSSLSSAFDGEGEAAFTAAVNRMTSRQRFYGMVWVVKAIDRTGGVDACAAPSSTALADRMRRLRMTADDVSYITFQRCSLSSLAAYERSD